MKKFFSLLAIAAISFNSFTAAAQAKDDKSKRPSPPAEATATLTSGGVITINYNQPSVKGRTIGKDLEPMKGKVWRTGANEATTFTTDKAITINGGTLPAGKYALFSIADDTEWIIIFSKTANQWGAYDYNEKDDALRVKGKVSKAEPFAEKLTFDVNKDGVVTLLWGDKQVAFTIQ